MKLKTITFEDINVIVTFPKVIEIPITPDMNPNLICSIALFKLLGCEIKEKNNESNIDEH